jgi:hypothetical protein
VVLQLGGWVWGQQPFTVKINLLGKLLKSPGPGWILWIIDPSYEGSLMTVLKELAR